jgi:hypothetical protein
MTKKARYPSFWQYTSVENLKQFVPSGVSKMQVVVKEFLDNACDATERCEDGLVDIHFEDEVFKVTNPGTITEKDFDVITNFEMRMSEKYIKRTYVRGQIGHGLRIAMMLSLREDNQIVFESGGYRHTITLINRNSYDPRGVLSLESRECKHPRDTTTVIVPTTIVKPSEINKVDNFIRNYIALNPQITFRYQGRTYEKTVDLKKSDKVDIFSYSLTDFIDFHANYSNCGFTTEEFLSLFNIMRTKRKQVLKECSAISDVQEIYRILKKNSKKLQEPVIGEEGIERRFKNIFGGVLKGYKKLSISSGFVEMALFRYCNSHSSVVVSGVNGVYMPPKSIDLWLSTLQADIRDLKIEDSVFFSYYTTTPSYHGTNKESVFIVSDKVKNALKNLYRRYSVTPKKQTWLLKADEYKEESSADQAVSEEAEKLGMRPQTYLFIMECKAIAEPMVKRYGRITLRQLYYQLVSKNIIMNSDSSYGNFKGHMGTARDCGLIEYEIFEDRSRYIIIPNTLSLRTDVESYIRESITDSLIIPALDLWEDQPYYVEVWIEKDALAGLFSRITEKKQVALFPSRGYTSLTKIEEARKRFKRQIRKGKKVVILYAGDLDPSGWDIYENICNKFSGEEGVRVERFALNPEQTKGLIPMPVKKSDTRYESFLEMHPDIKGAYELDAFDPDALQQLTEKTIDKYFDKSLLRQDKIDKWKEEFNAIKRKILKKLDK